MVNSDATLGEQLFDLAVGQAIPEVPAHRDGDQFIGEAKTAERRRGWSAGHPSNVPPRGSPNATLPPGILFNIGDRQTCRNSARNCPEHWSTQRAAEHGPNRESQHHLLLTVRGHSESAGPTIGQVAQHLCIRHNSAVELCDRTKQSGLVWRKTDVHDDRIVCNSCRRVTESRQAHLWKGVVALAVRAQRRSRREGYSDAHCELCERDAQPVVSRFVGGNFVVAAAHVLYEGVARGQCLSRPEAFQAAHRT